MVLVPGGEASDADPAAVEEILKVPGSREVIPEESYTLLTGRLDSMGAGVSWEPTVDQVDDATVLGRACRPGHSCTDNM